MKEDINPIITQYLQELKANGLRDTTLHKIRPTLIQLDNQVKGGIGKAKKKDITDFINAWSTNKESTKATRKMILKKFFTWNGKVEYVKDLKIKQPKGNLKAEDILNIDDVNKILETLENKKVFCMATSVYYKALIAVLFETGARLGEIQALKVGDFTETNEGFMVSIPTFKTDYPYRKVILPFSSGYVKNYLMYAGKSEDDRIFPYTREAIKEMFLKIKREAGLKKPVSAQKFRHAQATDMVRRGYPDSIIKKKLGWVGDSQMVARYIHVTDDDVINATIEKSGKDIPRQLIANMKQAERLTLIDASMQLAKISEENHELKKRLDERDTEMEKMVAEMIEKRVNQIMKGSDKYNEFHS